MSRHWDLKQGDKIEGTSGEGVIGQYPILSPLEQPEVEQFLGTFDPCLLTIVTDYLYLEDVLHLSRCCKSLNQDLKQSSIANLVWGRLYNREFVNQTAVDKDSY